LHSPPIPVTNLPIKITQILVKYDPRKHINCPKNIQHEKVKYMGLIPNLFMRTPPKKGRTKFGAE